MPPKARAQWNGLVSLKLGTTAQRLSSTAASRKCVVSTQKILPLMETLARFVIFAAFAIGVTAWVVAIIALITIPTHRKPGVPVFTRDLRWNPLNIIFRPDHLTSEGLWYRRLLGMAIVCFAVSLVVGLVFGISFGILK